MNASEYFYFFCLKYFCQSCQVFECTVIGWLGIVWMFQSCAPEGFLSVVVQYF